MKYFICTFLLLCSCSPNSSREFQQEGESRCQALVLELKKVENREQLLRAEPRLKKHFEALTSLMIEARIFQETHLDNEWSESNAYSAGAALEEQLRRIYTIEGGKEIIERSQNEALLRLDAFERAILKKKEQLKIPGA